VGKTYRAYPDDNCIIRKPKGHKQAIINNARKKAIPPSAWDDLPHNPECYLPFHIASRMIDNGFDDNTIIKKLKIKYKLTQRQAEEVLNSCK